MNQTEKLLLEELDDVAKARFRMGLTDGLIILLPTIMAGLSVGSLAWAFFVLYIERPVFVNYIRQAADDLLDDVAEGGGGAAPTGKQDAAVERRMDARGGDANNMRVPPPPPPPPPPVAAAQTLVQQTAPVKKPTAKEDVQFEVRPSVVIMGNPKMFNQFWDYDMSTASDSEQTQPERQRTAKRTGVKNTTKKKRKTRRR